MTEPRRRNRASAKAAGTRFERLIADYLATHIDDRIDRRVRNGAKDRGDIAGLRLSPALRGGRVVIECKDVVALALGTWLGEVERERGNDDAVAGLVVHKRRNTAHPGRQMVTCTLDDLIALITGQRPQENA